MLPVISFAILQIKSCIFREERERCGGLCVFFVVTLFKAFLNEVKKFRKMDLARKEDVEKRLYSCECCSESKFP